MKDRIVVGVLRSVATRSYKRLCLHVRCHQTVSAPRSSARPPFCRNV